MWDIGKEKETEIKHGLDRTVHFCMQEMRGAYAVEW